MEQSKYDKFSRAASLAISLCNSSDDFPDKEDTIKRLTKAKSGCESAVKSGTGAIARFEKEYGDTWNLLKRVYLYFTSGAHKAASGESAQAVFDVYKWYAAELQDIFGPDWMESVHFS